MKCDLTPLITYPYTIGVMLAVNAIRDAYLLLDAPACAQSRPGTVCGGHDLTSTLWNANGQHRVCVSCTSTEALIRGNREELARQMQKLAAVDGCGAVFSAGYPLVTVSGVAHESIWRNLVPQPGVPFFPVQGGALDGDWLDGYAQTLVSLAKRVEWAAEGLNERHVAIVGYMYDRGEADQRANLAELKRMLEGIGLDLVSVWPDGGPLSGLATVSSAATILSFPYGREAARIVAERTGAKVVVCDLPMGLGGSAEWLRRVGQAVGRSQQAEAFCDAELGRLVPLLEPAVSSHFRHSTFGFVGDPAMIRPLSGMVSEFGGEMLGAIGVASAHQEQVLGPWDDLPFPVYVGVPFGRVEEIAPSLKGLGDADCLLGTIHNALLGILWSEFPRRSVPIGYPSEVSHVFHPRPYLGFAGTACLFTRMLEEVMIYRTSSRSLKEFIKLRSQRGNAEND